MTENEVVSWHHRLNGYKSEQTPGDSEGQGSLVCCSHGDAESNMTEWTEQQQYRLVSGPVDKSVLSNW